MKYNPKYKVLFACPPPPAWCKFDGYMQVEAEYCIGSFQVTAQFAKELEISYTYDRESKYTKLVKVLCSTPKDSIEISRETWELLERRVRFPIRRKKR